MTAQLIVAIHAFIFSGIAVFVLMLMLRESYTTQVLAVPGFISLAIAIALWVVFTLI